MAADLDPDDLGELLHTERHRRRGRGFAVGAVVLLAVLVVVTHDAVTVAAAAAAMVVIGVLGAYVRFEVHERGVVIRGVVATRRYHWSQITAFSPMPDSRGRPGRTGAVVVDGVSREIASLREPGLYPKLRHLNARLLDHREETGIPALPAPDRRTGCSRSPAPLWLGPGAAWWPAEHPDRDRR